MKKEEVEKVMDLSFLLGRKKYAKDVSLVDIYDLSCKIWGEIQNEPKEDIVQFILFDRYEWEGFKYSRSLRIDIDDHKIEFLYAPNAFRLESGEIIDSDTDPYVGEELPEHFFDGDSPIKLLNSNELGSHIRDWIVEHKTEIQRILGFDIRILQKNKTLENYHRIDIYGKDNFGNSIIFYGDSGKTTDETLQTLLFKAIVSDSEKAVWIANDVQSSHACIINWLNENHVGGMMFYLIEARRVTTVKNKTAATSFRLVESPETGWGGILNE